MRTVNEIIVHCAATPEGKDFTVADIDRWHKARGWSGIGYHWVVYRDGSINKGRSEAKIGAHVAGRNSRTIGICYIGGVDANNVKSARDTRTPQQKDGLLELIKQIMKRHPTITKISGHHDYANKACPSFPARAEYAYLTKSKAPSKPAAKPGDASKPLPARLLKVGSRGWEVRALQKRLAELGYPLKADGMFGRGTKAAVMSFQSDQEIGTDGMVGPMTRAALDVAAPVDQGARGVITAKDMKSSSRIVKKGSMLKKASLIGGVFSGVAGTAQETGLVDSAQSLLAKGNQVRDVIGSGQNFMAWAWGHWWILIPVVAALAWWQLRDIVDARVEDEQKGKTT